MLSLRSILSRQNQSFAREKMLRKLSMTGFLWLACSLVHAQQRPAPRVYTYVEQMPQLPGGGGQSAIVGEVMKRLVFPTPFRMSEVANYTSGPTFSFIVRPGGQLDSARIVVSSNAPLVDREVLRAVNSLPKLVPGYQHDTAVAVRLTLRISCIKFQ